MAKFFSDAFKVFYDGFNPGTHTIGCTISLHKPAADVTAFGDVAEKGIVAVRQDSIDWAGIFDDDAQALNAGAALLATAGRVVSVAVGSATGSRYYAGTAIFVALQPGGRKGEIVPLAARFVAEGAWGTGQLLVNAPPQTVGSGTLGTGGSTDGVAATTNGGFFVVHVLSATGTRDILLQHSDDGTTWADLNAGSGTFGTATSTLIAVNGTIRRYTRWLLSATPSGGTFTFVAGVLRS